jgi:hypothetical protein
MTTKTIDTLIDDIKALVNDGHTVPKEAVQEFGLRLAEVISERLFEKRSHKQELRMSNLGTPCERKLWYAVSDDHVGEELPVEAKIKFLFGHILEELLLFLAEQSGHNVEHKQHTVRIGDVEGHIDCIIDGTLVDCKSASSFSYSKFAKHELADNDSFGYIDQLNGYLYAANVAGITKDKETFAFLVIDKQLGHICLDRYSSNGVNYDELVASKRAIVNSPTVPKRTYSDEPDGKSGNRKLPTVCGYCDYKHHCWENIRTFFYSNGPRYLTKVERVPDVPELGKTNW